MLGENEIHLSGPCLGGSSKIPRLISRPPPLDRVPPSNFAATASWLTATFRLAERHV